MNRLNRCPCCDEAVEEGRELCEVCLSHENFDRTRDFFARLDGLEEEFAKAAGRVDRCPTTAAKIAEVGHKIGELRKEVLAEYLQPSDRCVPPWKGESR
jgi:hypothetical protein